MVAIAPPGQVITRVVKWVHAISPMGSQGSAWVVKWVHAISAMGSQGSA